MSATIPPITTAGATERFADDAALLRRAVRGDGDAFAEIYDRHADHAHGMARRILGSSPATEDVVQDALLQLWRRGDGYDPARGSLRSWILVLVRSRALDLLRREKVRAAAAERALTDAAVRRDLAHDDDLDSHATARELRSSIVRLPREQAQVLGLLYLGGRTQSEVASVLDVPLGTVKGRTRLGLARLRRELLAEAA